MGNAGRRRPITGQRAVAEIDVLDGTWGDTWGDTWAEGRETPSGINNAHTRTTRHIQRMRPPETMGIIRANSPLRDTACAGGVTAKR